MSYAATVTSYLANRRLNPGDWCVLLDFVRNEKHDLGHAAQALYAPANVESGPSAADAEDEAEAGELAETARKNLALALLSRDARLSCADLDIIIYAVEEHDWTERCFPHGKLLDTLHVLAEEAMRREEAQAISR